MQQKNQESPKMIAKGMSDGKGSSIKLVDNNGNLLEFTDEDGNQLQMIPSVDYFELVQKFHETFGHPVGEKVQILDDKRGSLRVKLMQEELNEFTQAAVRGDLIEMIDALSDLQYVLTGTIIEMGLQDKFDQIFAEVHRSNMSKVCKDQNSVDRTLKYYEEKNPGIVVGYADLGEYKIVKNMETDKILKSVDWSKPDIKGVLDS